MKITKEYLRKLINESIEEIAGEDDDYDFSKRDDKSVKSNLRAGDILVGESAYGLAVHLILSGASGRNQFHTEWRALEHSGAQNEEASGEISYYHNLGRKDKKVMPGTPEYDQAVSILKDSVKKTLTAIRMIQKL